jgi:hypothetical protein
MQATTSLESVVPVVNVVLNVTNSASVIGTLDAIGGLGAVGRCTGPLAISCGLEHCVARLVPSVRGSRLELIASTSGIIFSNSHVLGAVTVKSRENSDLPAPTEQLLSPSPDRSCWSASKRTPICTSLIAKPGIFATAERTCPAAVLSLNLNVEGATTPMLVRASYKVIRFGSVLGAKFFTSKAVGCGGLEGAAITTGLRFSKFKAMASPAMSKTATTESSNSVRPHASSHSRRVHLPPHRLSHSLLGNVAAPDPLSAPTRVSNGAGCASAPLEDTSAVPNRSSSSTLWSTIPCPSTADSRERHRAFGPSWPPKRDC